METTHLSYKSILVIDDHKMVANGIKLIAGRLFESFYMAHSGASGMSQALQNFPELIIVDFYLPDIPGDSLVRQLKEKLPSARIMAYSFSYSPDIIIKMLKAGIDGYIIKREDDEEFIKAIHMLMRGRDYFCKEARAHIVNRFSTATDDFTVKHLIGNTKFSGKELELIRLLCKQMTTKEIGHYLSLSERTIEQYRSNIMRKLNAKTLAGVIKFAIQNGVVMLDEL
ncbi:response regulator transcription factor [Niabella sp. CC-SYL272]|uniref:response regulator n=1 Tax=Niabella agricola TaxID=2891571 RepID=UPI001F27E57B|nr:response regulator transcription factor [Niabella agricola]MCF3108990.1 response regulator transcription factor [Niabella agricola]